MVSIDDIKTCNPVYGCPYKCIYCYASRLNQRFKITPDFSVPIVMPQALKKIHSTKPTPWFMTSMSDFSCWSLDWRNQVFEEMKKYPKNEYMFLTKRPDLIKIDCKNMKNVWLGVTITKAADLWRIKEMKKNMKASKYWLCIEPLHGDCGILDLDGIGMIIVGAETGFRPGKIVPQQAWIDGIVAQAKKRGIPVWMKDSLLGIPTKFIQDNLPLC